MGSSSKITTTHYAVSASCFVTVIVAAVGLNCCVSKLSFSTPQIKLRFIERPDVAVSYPIVNQVVHPPEIEATSSSDTKLVGIGRVKAEERHVARKNSLDNLRARLVRTVSNSTCLYNCKTDCPRTFRCLM